MLKMLRSINVEAIAFYLPQFHHVPENDSWWGNGFTDWDTVKTAQKYYKNQNEPRVPLNGYYDLMSKKTLKWQAQMAEKAGLYGFCFYHYWFKNGKQILEKPSELLLKNKDIKMRFCFSWANESWIRSWSRMDGNVWTDRFDNKKFLTAEASGVLLQQDYGLEKEWKEHFNYLHPFFCDDRYIRIDNKPVFIIYRPNSIPRLAHMIRCWKKWAKETGLDGLYIIGTIHHKKEYSDRILDAELLHSPNSAMNELIPYNRNGVKCYQYDRIWKSYLKDVNILQKKRYFCGVVDYDTTPRKGLNGTSIVGMTPTKFYYNMKRLVRLSKKNKNEFLFINAWNEWGESMYLEPDTVNRFACLNVLKRIFRS